MQVELWELFNAYYTCRGNKRNTHNALSFEVDYENNLVQLCNDINNNHYKIGRAIAFIVKKPVIREIFAADAQNEVVIGYNAIGAGSNTIQLGNSSITSIGGQVSWTAASDVRIKKNIVNTHYGLATVMQLRPVDYMLKNNDLKQVGFIAQEVQKLVPEVITGKEGDLEKGEILGITYANLVPVLTKAIQEQQKQIEEQNKKIEYLIKLLETKK